MQFDLSSRRTQDVSGWLSLDPQQRVNLHPLFKSIEEYTCVFLYNPKFKCFWVDHHFNEDTQKFEQSILSNIPASIVDDVQGVLNIV